MSGLKQPISLTVWENKYRYARGGQIIDHNITDTWQRVAKAIAKAESKTARPHWQAEFYRILEDFQFLPGGRILAGAGTAHHVTLFNCFVMPIREDSLKGIFTTLQEAALTLQQGGGVGFDFSVLRPFGETAKKTGIQASGPVSFMQIWDTMCSVLLSTGTRRGAMMGVMRCDHPDIEAFIEAKQDARLLRHFNLSVMVSDKFMQAVANDEEWPLVFPVEDQSGKNTLKTYRTVNARQLWQKIIRAAYDYAEPGVLFGDTINRNNNLWYRENIVATNPCGEIPLPPYGACDLGAINLTQFIDSPFTSHAKLQLTRLEEVTRIATRFLDNVIDVSRYPLKAQREQAMGTRRIGLGVTGLADALVMLGVRYGSPQSFSIAGDIMQRVAHVTWQTSIELAAEKGSFPFYSPDYLHGQFVETLDENIRLNMEKQGMRNSHHNTIAPTGTISILANNISNGIEPIFRAEYVRQMQVNQATDTAYRVMDYAYDLWCRESRSTSLPQEWVDAEMLAPAAHLQMQGVMQTYIDNAISKTINLPVDFPFAKVTDIYTQAYQLGLKGCTIFRPNLITGSVLTDEKNQEKQCCRQDE